MNFPIIFRMMIQKVLIVRADNIGDWVLTTPTLGLLLERYPGAKIDVMGQDYVQMAIEACPYVNRFISYDTLLKSSNPSAILEQEGYDLAIAISKHPKAVNWIHGAKIPFRIGALNRIHTWLKCNSLPLCSRFKHYPHEAQKTVQFLKPLGVKKKFSIEELTHHIRIEPKGELPIELEDLIAKDKFNLVLHPGSNNHGREWSIEQYAELIRRLPKDKFQIFVTGRENENGLFAPYLPEGEYVNLMGKTSLNELILFLTKVQGLVASGTGTVHLAAAIGIHTLALFPSKYKIGSLAWQPLGPHAEYIQLKDSCSVKCSDGKCPCLNNISVDRVLKTICQWS